MSTLHCGHDGDEVVHSDAHVFGLFCQQGSVIACQPNWQQAPWFAIAHAVQIKPVRKEVIGFKLSPFGRHSFYGVDIKE